MLIDTHCHLDASEFDVDRAQVVARAARAGVCSIVIPAVDRTNFEVVARLAHATDGAAYALGIHPMYVDRADDADLDHLRQLIADSIDDPRLVAVGEIGLDFFVQGSDRERQRRFFSRQLEIAREFDLPVLLHVRRAQDDVLKHLRRTPPPSGIAHAFNGSLQQAQAFLALGCALGFGGAMTFERALQIRRLAAGLPAQAHVLETDSPDIAPSWLARGRNEPGELRAIAEVFADLRQEPIEAVLDCTGANALRVLPRLANLLR
jgi:TatD DNase family protein